MGGQSGMNPKVFQYLQLALPLVPGLIDEVIGVVERWTSKPETDEATRAALAQLVQDIRVENAKMQTAPRPGDEPTGV